MHYCFFAGASIRGDAYQNCKFDWVPLRQALYECFL